MSSSPPSAGGVLIAVGAIGGTAVGIAAGQPTLGFLGGVAVSTTVAVLLWLRAR